MASAGPLHGSVTLTIRGRVVRIRKVWFLLGPAFYLIGSAVVGTYLASRNPERFTARLEEASGPAAPGSGSGSGSGSGENPTGATAVSDVRA